MNGLPLEVERNSGTSGAGVSSMRGLSRFTLRVFHGLSVSDNAALRPSAVASPRGCPMSARHYAVRHALTVAVAAIALAACTGNPSGPGTAIFEEVSATPTSTEPTSPAPPTKDPAVAAAETDVLAVYQEYWDAQVTAFSNPKQYRPAPLRDLLMDDLYLDFTSQLFHLELDGIEYVGAPVLSPEITSLDLGDEASATVKDCLDLTEWQAVFAETSESAEVPGQTDHLPMTTEVRRIGGDWLIASYELKRTESC